MSLSLLTRFALETVSPLGEILEIIFLMEEEPRFYWSMMETSLLLMKGESILALSQDLSKKGFPLDRLLLLEVSRCEVGARSLGSDSSTMYLAHFIIEITLSMNTVNQDIPDHQISAGP